MATKKVIWDSKLPGKKCQARRIQKWADVTSSLKPSMKSKVRTAWRSSYKAHVKKKILQKVHEYTCNNNSFQSLMAKPNRHRLDRVEPFRRKTKLRMWSNWNTNHLPNDCILGDSRRRYQLSNIQETNFPSHWHIRLQWRSRGTSLDTRA